MPPALQLLLFKLNFTEMALFYIKCKTRKSHFNVIWLLFCQIKRGLLYSFEVKNCLTIHEYRKYKQNYLKHCDLHVVSLNLSQTSTPYLTLLGGGGGGGKRKMACLRMGTNINTSQKIPGVELPVLDHKITSDGSFFVKRQQRPPLVPMMDVGSLGRKDHPHLVAHLPR